MSKAITIFQAPGKRGQGNSADGFIEAHTIEPGDVATFAAAVAFDNCPACYADGYRTGKNFISADCILKDVDNKHSNDPADWITPEDVAAAFPGVAMYQYPSRNNMKDKTDAKTGKVESARPRFHNIMPIEPITDIEAYTAIMKQTTAAFPQLYFDKAVSGPAQLNYGVEGAAVTYIPGDMNLSEFMRTQAGGNIKPGAVSASESSEDITPSVLSDAEIIEKARAAANGAKFIALYDNGDLTAYNDDESAADMALLNILAFWTRKDPAQMERIFSQSALGQRAKWQERADYRERTITRAIADCREVYEAGHYKSETDEFLKPSDYTDVGESTVLSMEYGGVLRHSAATKYIVYDGKVWVENDARARGCLHELTARQLEEHKPELMKTKAKLEAAERNGNKLLIAAAQAEYDKAVLYQKFILRCRNSKNISGVMREAQTPLEIDVAELDKDPFLLNTPGGEVDLRTGELLPHNPEHFHTKITAVTPSDEGTEEWAAFLKVITCSDAELEEHLQVSSGQEAIGKVFEETMEILFGDGRNGKSTYMNAKGRVLGDYTGQITAETLTTGRKTGKNWEIAGIRGKRLIIAPELEEGTRLDAAFVKKICSTDKIKGEKKYKDPFDFEPSHTVALFTNHLPRVGSNDAGTWRRLVVIPFNAVIEGTDDIKNYADYLYRHAGGAILKWIIEGARKFIAAGYHIEPPPVVKNAIEAYRQQNDWLSNYISERCEVDPKHKEKSGELYADYRAYCANTGDYIRSLTDFKAGLESAGYTSRKTKTGAFVYGLQLSLDNHYLGVRPL